MIYGKNEYIKLNRNIVTWSRYKNVNDKVVFIHCLLKANWKDGEWKGVPVKRGQFISSVSKIAEECGLTYSKVRTSLDHLIFDENIETNVLDLSQEHSRKHLQGKPTLFTVVDYDKYQAFSENIETNSQEFSENNLRSLTTIEEVKNRERSKEVKNNNNPPLSPLGEKDDEKPVKKTITVVEAQEEINRMIDESDLSPELKEKVKEFVAYKRTIKDGYKSPTHFKPKIKAAGDCEKQYGTDATIKCIDDCMGNGYRGMIFDKAWKYAKEKPQQQSFNMEDFLRGYE